jgi:hypothetical protein
VIGAQAHVSVSGVVKLEEVVFSEFATVMYPGLDVRVEALDEPKPALP